MTEFDSLSIRDFNSALASSNPTPGGGTACAVALSNAMSLTAMVSSITIGREKWNEGWSAAKESLLYSNPKSIQWAMSAASDDASAFDAVMEAYRLPKGEEGQNIVRKTAIQGATKGAADVPLKVAKKALLLLQTLPNLAKYGNGNAVTDVAVAALLCDTACKGAIFNVRINISSLSADYAIYFNSELSGMLTECSKILEKVIQNVEQRL
jgi:formiminotetrahydrofolate cyclodeaminase